MPTNRLGPEEVEDEMKRYRSCLTVSTHAEYVIWLREFKKRENKFQQAATRIWLKEQLDRRLEVDYRFQTGEAEEIMAKINAGFREDICFTKIVCKIFLLVALCLCGV